MLKRHFPELNQCQNLLPARDLETDVWSYISERQSKYRLAGTRPLPGEPVFGNVTISPTLCFIKSHPN